MNILANSYFSGAGLMDLGLSHGFLRTPSAASRRNERSY